MYWEVWYNNKSLPENQSLIYYENLLLGVPRLRQVKVRNETCSIHADLREEFQDCYNMYTPSNEDVSSFGPKIGTAYVHAMHLLVSDLETSANPLMINTENNSIYIYMLKYMF